MHRPLTWSVAAIPAALLQSMSTNAFPQSSNRIQFRTSSLLNLSEYPTRYEITDVQRRQLLSVAIASCIVIDPMSSIAATLQQIDPSTISSSSSPHINGIHDMNLRNYHNPNLPNWQGTSLDVLSLQAAAKSISAQHLSDPSLPMGRWPDPALRRAASRIPTSVFQSRDQLNELQSVAVALRNTARKEGAVGLAAQQCGVDASLIFIDGVRERKYGMSIQSAIPGEGKSNRGRNVSDGIFLVNPRIIKRSVESDMLIWTEECLVLPPEFRATLLRDASVTIEYETLDGEDSGITKQITLKGELARCAQHEMDHDRGVLIVDHVSLDELLSAGGDDFMARIENSDGLHGSRMQRAFERYVSESTLLPPREKLVPLAYESNDGLQSKVFEVDYYYNFELRERSSKQQSSLSWFIKPAHAADDSPSSVPNRGIQRDQYQAAAAPPPTTTSQSECDAACIEERKAIIEKRRTMMQQSRSNTNRGDVLKLSEQRAALYGTGYGGLPSNTCTAPGFCP